MTPIISLAPLNAEDHAAALGGLPGDAALLGDVRTAYRSGGGPPATWMRSRRRQAAISWALSAIDPANLQVGGGLIGLADFRLYWPEERMAYLGMLMVAERYQRQGVDLQAWRLLVDPWLASMRHPNSAARRGAVQPGRSCSFRRRASR